MTGASDLVIVLIADSALAASHRELFSWLKPGAAIGLSHGFLVGYLRAVGEDFPAGHDVIGCAPRGWATRCAACTCRAPR